MKLKITRCEGEGLGVCKRCEEIKGFNRYFMTFLYEIDGYKGCYCRDCVNAIKAEVEKQNT